MTDTPTEPLYDIDWDRSEHGRMADHATPDDTVTTIPREGR